MTLETHARVPARFERMFEVPGPTVRLSDHPLSMQSPLAIAWLAYPEVRDAGLRVKTKVRLALLRDPANVGKDLMPIEAALLNYRTIEGGMPRLLSRMRKRMEAGRLALQPLLAAERGQKTLHRWGANWNRSAAIREAGEPTGVVERRNFERRILDPAAAVIHLAAAFYAIEVAAAKNGDCDRDIVQLLVDPAYLTKLVVTAIALEALVGMSELGIPSEVLVKIRP